jgi:hypothetical protein
LLRSHLDSCDQCRAEYARIDRLLGLVESVIVDSPRDPAARYAGRISLLNRIRAYRPGADLVSQSFESFAKTISRFLGSKGGINVRIAAAGRDPDEVFSVVEPSLELFLGQRAWERLKGRLSLNIRDGRGALR